MNVLSVTESTIAFCGRQYIHLYSTKFDKSKASLRSQYSDADDLVSLDLHKHMPEGVKTNLDRVSAICCNLTEDGQFLCAGDSEKNVFVFQKIRRTWEHFASFAMEKRVLKTQFDNDAINLIIVDKCGDVWVGSMNSPNAVARPAKLVGLSALTLDTVMSLNNRRMLTCDGQIKLYVTKFPDASEVKTYTFGRAETIANVILFDRDQMLLSVSGHGYLKIWNMDDHRCLKTFNLFQVIHGVHHTVEPETEVKHVRLSEAYGHTYFGIKVFGYKEIPIFELLMKDPMVRQLGQVKMDSEFCDFGWYKNNLFTYNPELNVVLKRFTVSSHGVLCDPNFQIPRESELRLDFRAFALFMQSTLSLRKHFSSDLIRLSQGQKLMDEFIEAAEKKIPRLVRGNRSRGLDLVEMNSQADPESEPPSLLNGSLPIPVSLKYFRGHKFLDKLLPNGARSPIAGPSNPRPSAKIQTESIHTTEEAKSAALSHYPRLMQVDPSEESEEPRPLTRGQSRILQNLLKKCKDETEIIASDENETKEETLSRPTTAGKGRPKSKPAIFYLGDDLVEITKDPPDPEVTRISRETSHQFLETLRIARPSSSSRKPHWPSELKHIVSSKPPDLELDTDDDEIETQNEGEIAENKDETEIEVKTTVEPGTAAEAKIEILTELENKSITAPKIKVELLESPTKS